MYKGIKRGDVFPYIAKVEQARMPVDDGSMRPPSELPTIWGLRAQNTETGNRNYVPYIKARGQQADDAVADAWTSADLNQFLTAVAWARNYCFRDEKEPRVLIDNPEDLRRVFAEIDVTIAAELSNASKDAFALRDGEKNVLSSSYGRALLASTPAGSSSTANDAPKKDQFKVPAA